MDSISNTYVFMLCIFLLVLSVAADIIVLIDSSNRMRQVNFKIALELAKIIFIATGISRKGVHAGVVIYSTRSQALCNLRNCRSVPVMARRVSKATFVGGRSGLPRALNRANRLFKRSRRPQASQILVIIAAGKYRGNMMRPAKRMKSRGVTIFGMGIGTKYPKNLPKVCSGPPFFYAGLNLRKLNEVEIKDFISKLNNSEYYHH